jgi:hypothetical protein
MYVTREETRCGRTLPCELARISLRDMARVVPAGVCGVPVVVGCSRTWPDETGGSLLGPPGLLLPATPVFADVLSVYERLNRLRVTVDPSANAAAIWS